MSIANLLGTKPDTQIDVSENTKKVASSFRNVFPKKMMKDLGKMDLSTNDTKVDSRTYGPYKGGSKTENLRQQTDDNTETYSNKPESASKLLNNILNVLISNREEDVRQRELMRATREERRNEEQRNHERFVQILKAYTGVKTTAPTEKEEFGLWDFIKGFVSDIFDTLMKPLKWLFDSSLLKWIAKFATPAALGLALLAFSKELSPGTLFDEKGNPTEEYRKTLVKDKTNVMRPFDSKEADLVPTIESATDPMMKQKWENENARGAKLFPEEAAAVKEKYDIEWNQNNILNQKNISSMKYKAPENQSFKPKYSYADAPDLNRQLSGETPLPEGVVPSTAQGRSSVDFSATDPRRLDLLPPPPAEVDVSPSARLNNAIEQNSELQMSEIGQQSVAQPIVSNNVSGSTVEEAPVSTQPKVRDSVPILERVFRSIKSTW